MKAIINGKRYDTETAELIAYWDNGRGESDHSHRCESLYRTKSGAYFLHGSGGPLTEWKRPAGDMWTSGEGIQPLPLFEALAWCEGHASSDVLEEHFGDHIQDA